MYEEWRDIPDFPGYQVSNTGKVRSFWLKRKKNGAYGTERILTDKPHELLQSDDGDGYMKVYLQNNSVRKCVKVHRLVAENFIEKESEEYDTVDHIISGPKGKLNNSVENLRWISRRANIQKAYKDGVCDERIYLQNKNVLVTDLYDGREVYFTSTREAADWLGVNYTTVSHAIKENSIIRKHYKVQHLNGKDKLLYDGGEFDARFYNN